MILRVGQNPSFTTQGNSMTSKKSVSSVGLQPQLINFADPPYAAFSSMTADKVQDGLKKEIAALNAMGYDAQLCLTDFGETAEVQTLGHSTRPRRCSAGARFPEHGVKSRTKLLSCRSASSDNDERRQAPVIDPGGIRVRQLSTLYAIGLVLIIAGCATGEVS